MSVTEVTSLLQETLLRSGQGVFVSSDGDFINKLTVGQILKAKIMRHYEGGRYLADFSGQQRVIDSTIPLRVGETITARVTSLGDQVHMQRVFSPDEVSSELLEKTQKPGTQSHQEQLINQIFDRYQGVLKQQDKAQLLQLISRISKPDVMTLSGLVLSKLGMKLHPEFLSAVYRVLANANKPISHSQTPPIAELHTDVAASHHESTDAVDQLSTYLLKGHVDEWRNHMSDHRDVGSNKGIETDQGQSADSNNDSHTGSGDSDYNEWLLGQWLLNSQSEGTIAHRMTTIPLWFGSQLIEVNVALFTQKENSSLDQGIDYRRIVLSLDTNNLGHVEIVVKVANRHLSLTLTSEHSETTAMMSRYIRELKELLIIHDWQVDEIEYCTATKDQQGQVVSSVVEHYISQDSLSRLM